MTVTNVELLEASLQLGRGVYLAMSHHGPLHVGAMLFCVQGYKTVGVRDRNEGAIRRYVQRRFDLRYPEFRRMRVLFADHFPREIYRCFQEGYVVASAMDVSRVRDPSQRMVEVEAFGERRSFLSGPLHVAYRCKATVLQAFVVPEREFRYRVEITQRLMDPNTEEAEDVDVPRAMHVYAANVESFVRHTRRCSHGSDVGNDEIRAAERRAVQRNPYLPRCSAPRTWVILRQARGQSSGRFTLDPLAEK